MKTSFMKKLGCLAIVSFVSSCNPWVIYQPNNGGVDFDITEADDINYVNDYGLTVAQRYIYSIEEFKDCSNSLFFALYNYYGYEGQHFTNKWLGMNDALGRHGITVTGYEKEKDARKFKIKREANCDLPEDADIYMVNNQNWDSGIQYTTPFAKRHPMAVMSTCNGVEFTSSPILSSGQDISNATMGGFSPTYRNAFLNGSLSYLCAKYTAHILPIFAACVDAVDNGGAIKNADGSALRLEIVNWAIQTIDQYDEMNAVDKIGNDNTTVRKLNVDKFFDRSVYSAPGAAANALATWTKEGSSAESIKTMYAENKTKYQEDFNNKRTGSKFKVGIIAPSSVNDQVQSYIDYINGYLAEIYNVEVLPTAAVSGTISQDAAAKTLCNQGAKFVISLQDDTDRNSAAQTCNENGVYFAIGGSCQNPIDYEVIKNLPYYVGSVGTSPEEERAAADRMTEYYLQCMIRRNQDDFMDWQIEYKGLTDLKVEFDKVVESRRGK